MTYSPTLDDDFGPWYTPREAAPQLGLSVKDVQELCAKKGIEHRRINGRYTISLRAIAHFNRQTRVRTERRHAA